MTQITAEILQSWDEASRREWLVTNGIGGYASSSLAGANTRRYHGLLVPAFEPPLGRAVVFSKLEEEVRVEDSVYLLSANKYPSVVQPQGFRHLTYFTSDPVPCFTYIFHEGTVVLEKHLWMTPGQNSIYVQYRLIKAPEPIRLGLVPLMAYKDYHTEQHRWDGFHGTVTTEPDKRLKFVAYETAHPVLFGLDAPFAWSDHSGWFYNFEHPREQERGLDYSEDLYCPGRWDGTVAPGQSVTLIATAEPTAPEPAREALKRVHGRQKELLDQADVPAGTNSYREKLTLAADQFVVEKTGQVARATIIAGYHWFTDWGRDTMISLPGLCLATGRFGVAREILTTFAGAVHNGLLPNRFSDTGGGAEYNTVDASLWFFHAVHQYAIASGDWGFATGTMLPVLQDILAHHIAGTDYGIGVDPADGLLHAGEAGVQLTWMDAKVGDWVVTPRTGKPVEINALWHNALHVAADLAERAGQSAAASEYRQRASQTKASFQEAFCNPATHSLFDVISPDGRPDASMRPNQIFAVSLPFPVIEGTDARAIVDQIGEFLLTPYGLRTLAPGLPDYQGRYGPGDQRTRDGAYHQGTVWPWLLGAYIEAHLKVYHDKAAARNLLEPYLADALSDYGIGTLCEIRDGDAPHAPNGCIAQAWSVAELLRALILVS
jgi:predicted glycogen debranching enzyme